MTKQIKFYVDGSAINNENPNVPTLGGVAIFFVKYPGIVDRNEPVGFYERIVDHEVKGIYLNSYLRRHSDYIDKSTTRLRASWGLHPISLP